MRYLSLTILAVAAYVVPQFSMAQESSVPPAPSATTLAADSNKYDFRDYSRYQKGVVVQGATMSIKGNVYKPIPNDSQFEAFPGVELSLVRGTEVVAKTTSGADGSFSFTAPTANYQLHGEYNSGTAQAYGSGAITPVAASANVTDSADLWKQASSVKLVLSDQLYVLDKNDETTRPEQQQNQPQPSSSTPIPSTSGSSSAGPASGGGGGALAGGALGGAGLIGAALGTAGLAVAASNNNTTPVSNGAPVSGR